MPRGEYLHLGDGAVEHFQCAAGPVGWRYVADVRPDAAGPRLGSVDLTVDARWRQLRLEMRFGGWLARGGVVGRDVLWLRAREAGAEPAEHSDRAAGFAGRSPAFLVAVARMLALAPGADARIRLVRLEDPALAALAVEERWTLAEVSIHHTDVEPLRVERYEVADLATGETRSVHLAGDVVVAGPDIELRDLSGPPHQPPANDA